MLVFIAFAFLVLTCVWLRRPKRPARFPPGPPMFLVFGNLSASVELLKGNFISLMEVSRRQFGDIVGFIPPAGKSVVHLFNFDDIKDACGKHEFAGRMDSFLSLLRSYHQQLGIVFSQGPAWVEHRRFALRHLKDLGFGKQSTESIVIDEFEELAKDMIRDSGSPMKVNCRFNLTVLNVLWRLVADKRLDSHDPHAQTYVDTVNEFFEVVNPRNPLHLAPWLRYIAPEWSGYNAVIRHRSLTTGMFKELVREHQRTLDRSSPRDFIDLFLLEMEASDAEGRQFTEQNLAIIGMDLFIAGMETTSTSLSWALLFMVLHPEVQGRVQREIDAVLGGRHPAYADRKAMPYTEATLMEVTRRATVLPFSVGHCAVRDADLAGYTIPKGTVLMMHLNAVHMDAAYWGDPHVFRPERFLQPDGSVRRDERLIPFGVGRRICLGETLARMEMFVLFTCLLQRFSFVAAPGQKLSLDSRVSSVQQPMEFFVTYQVRDGQ
ncbi:methyl farnesoate epoxidase-like [Pollicipes pollicipes]|uniref:methyl farnesoate epoxidase-like n=1 Tax=Pollicipes pollicipes TaxID=41117 RepID=UPI001884A975|nr:methyl farnesoate epoxidase-like [Pollicipes pollicipes]